MTEKADSVNLVVTRIIKALHPSAIFLFGSRAWGSPGSDSDVDLMVILKSSDDPPWTRATKALEQLRGAGVGCDLLVKTEAEVDRESRFPSSLTSKILRDGKKIYTSPR